MKENNEKKMKDEDEISKLIKAFPKDIAPKYKSFPMLKITIITMKDTGSTLLKSYYIISNLLGIDRIMKEKTLKRPCE